MTTPKLYRHNGLSLPLKEWASIAGLGVPTLEARLKRGWSFSDCVTFGAGERTREGSRTFKFKGRTMSLSEWARTFEVPLSTLHSRICTYGWSFKDAITLEARERRANSTGVRM